LIGLAETGSEGLALATEIYTEALDHIDELCAPYASVIAIERAKLPDPATVSNWTSEQFVAALRHDSKCEQFNPDFRQLLHVSYRIAAQKRERYLNLVQRSDGTIARNVTGNLFERHLRPVFIGA